MKVQKTYHGKTAGGWIRDAYVAGMSAGNFEIVHDNLPGMVFGRYPAWRHITILDCRGRGPVLMSSDRAWAKMDTLWQEADQLAGAAKCVAVIERMLGDKNKEKEERMPKNINKPLSTVLKQILAPEDHFCYKCGAPAQGQIC